MKNVFVILAVLLSLAFASVSEAGFFRNRGGGCSSGSCGSAGASLHASMPAPTVKPSVDPLPPAPPVSPKVQKFAVVPSDLNASHVINAATSKTVASKPAATQESYQSGVYYDAPPPGEYVDGWIQSNANGKWFKAKFLVGR